jgi:hypothetical protein
MTKIILLTKRVLNRIANFFKRSEKIIEVSYEQKREIIDSYLLKFDLKLFIETGTFLGDTVYYFKNKFDQLYSIELSEELAERAKKRFKEDQHITIIQGDSANVLSDLKPALNKKALFWLDGHYSSEFFYNGEYIITAKADKNTPIEKELEIILSSEFMNVILIDDARLFVGKDDYPTLGRVKQIVALSGKPYTVHEAADIIHIIPSTV